MTLIFNRRLEVVKVHVFAKCDQAKCSCSGVVVLAEKMATMLKTVLSSLLQAVTLFTTKVKRSRRRPFPVGILVYFVDPHQRVEMKWKDSDRKTNSRLTTKKAVLFLRHRWLLWKVACLIWSEGARRARGAQAYNGSLQAKPKRGPGAEPLVRVKWRTHPAWSWNT